MQWDPLVAKVKEALDSPFESSVVPGAVRFRGMKFDSQSEQKAIVPTEKLIEQGLYDRVERKLKKQEEREANDKFKDLEERINQKLSHKRKMKWDHEKRLTKVLKEQHESFRLERKKVSVARKREVLQLFAAKCRTNTNGEQPSQAEVVTEMVGDASMFSPGMRELSKSILNKKGIIMPQSVEEKYNTVFKRYTLTPHELEARLT